MKNYKQMYQSFNFNGIKTRLPEESVSHPYPTSNGKIRREPLIHHF